MNKRIHENMVPLVSARSLEQLLLGRDPSPFDREGGAVLEGMKIEMSQLETLKVGICLPKDEGRELANKANVKILSSRWVLAQKKVGSARCRLVVREFASGAICPRVGSMPLPLLWIACERCWGPPAEAASADARGLHCLHVRAGRNRELRLGYVAR